MIVLSERIAQCKGSLNRVLISLLVVLLSGLVITAPILAQSNSGLPSVTSVTLIDAATNQPIPQFDPLISGAVINLADLGTNLNLRANTDAGAVGSVVFGWDGNAQYSVENSGPYAIGGDSGGNYNVWTPSVGEHILTITAYTEQNGGGTSGIPLTLSFTVMNEDTSQPELPEDSDAPTLPQPTEPAQPEDSAPFLERGGLIVMEAEHGIAVNADGSQWDIESTISGYGGSGYIRWNGPNHFDDQSHGILSYPIKITTAGRYHMRLRSFHDPESEGETSDQQNDAWTSGILKGVDSTSTTLFKTFRSGSTAGQPWNFATEWEPNHGEFLKPEYDLLPGDYEFLIAARSQHYMIDRIYLYHEGMNESVALTLAQPESDRDFVERPSDPVDDNGPVTDDLPSEGPETENPNGGGTVTGDLIKWHPITVSFDGPNANEGDGFPHAFLDYRLQVTFTGPNGQTYRVPGFFAGDGNGDIDGSGSGGVWQARFSADQAGVWRYQASFRTGENIAIALASDAGEPASFDNANGSFTVVDLDPTAPGFLKWGRLNYVENHYLKFADGPYWIKGGIDSPENFFGFADFDNTVDQGCKGIIHEYATHVADWQSGDPTWVSDNGGDGKGIIGALNYLGSQDVNSIYFLPLNLGGDGCETYPFIDPSGNASANTRYDISKLAQWDMVMRHAQEQGIALHFVLNETESGNERWLDGGSLGVERKLFYRELIARFGYLLAIKWNLSEENDFSDSELSEFADYISQLDWAKHQLTVHTHPERLDQYNGLLDDANFDATSIQYEPDNAGDYVETMRQRSAAAGRPWVIDMDENNPAGTGLTDSNASDLRKRTLYDVYFSGGHIEWYFGYHNLPLGGDMKTEDFRTRQEMYGYMGHARRLMQENLPFWEMEPADELLAGEDDSFGGGEVFAKAGEFYAAYLPNASNEDATLDLTEAASNFETQWFNPRSGEFTDTTDTVNGGTLLQLGNPPADSEEDWVLLIKKVGATVPQPAPTEPPDDGTITTPEGLEPVIFLPIIDSPASTASD